MSFKKQMKSLKENWVLILVGIIFLFVFSFLFNSSGYSFRDSIGVNSQAMDYGKSAGAAYDSAYYPSSESNFAPGQEVRKIITTANLSLKIKNNLFESVDSKIKNIVDNSDAYILKKNASKNNNDLYSASYTIKVEHKYLDSTIISLKELGEVTSFSEGEDDVTGKYTDLELELEVEKEKLNRYKELYASQETSQSNKIDLIDKMFYQERRVEYLEDAIENIDQKVEYSTIYLNVYEYSNYINIAFVKLSDLVRTLVASVNSLLQIIVGILPYAIILYFGYFLFKLKKKYKRSKRK